MHYGDIEDDITLGDKQKFLALRKIQMIVKAHKKHIMKEENIKAFKEDKPRNECFTIQKPKVIKPVEQMILKQKLYEPYMFDEVADEYVATGFPRRIVPRQIYLHFMPKKDICVNIKKFVNDLSERVNYPYVHNKIEHQEKQPPAKRNTELIALMPKLYKFGDYEPKEVMVDDYINSFNAYKLNPKHVINFFKDNLFGRDRKSVV